MTITAPAPATALSLSKPGDTAYDKALRLSGVLQCVAHLENDSACNDGRIALVYLAEELAADLVQYLDPPPVPKAVAA